MKTKLLFLVSLLTASAALAAPLAQSASVHVRPATNAPTLTTLPAGSTPVALTTGYGVLPPGWIAVEVPGPHEVFVQQKDLTKSLDVKPGAPLHRDAKPESEVLATAAEGDVTEIIGLRGRWTQLLLKKNIVGYIQVSGAPAPAANPAPMAAPAPRATPQANIPPPAPVAGQAVPIMQTPGEQALPRLFQGRLTSTRNPLRPRRPYDYQLTSEEGERYAYADLSKLLLTEQLDKYLDRTVVVYGAAQQVPNTKDIVIVVESLQLR